MVLIFLSLVSLKKPGKKNYFSKKKIALVSSKKLMYELEDKLSKAQEDALR